MRDTEDNRLAHFNMIQGVISRMAHNSFLLKGWSVTLVAAVIGVAAVEMRGGFTFLALLPALVFWGLDAYYLRQERLFRCLYDNIRMAPQGALHRQAFSLDASAYDGQVQSWLGTTLCEPTVAIFHGAILLAVIVGITVLVTVGG